MNESEQRLVRQLTGVIERILAGDAPDPREIAELVPGSEALDGLRGGIAKLAESHRKSRQSMTDLTGAIPDGEQLLLLENIFKYSPDTILLARVDGQTQFVSPAGKQMFGISDEDVRDGINYRSFIHEDDRERARQNNIKRGSGQLTGPEIYKCTRRDGSIIWVEMNGTILKEPDGQPRGIFAVIRDITSRKEQQAFLEESSRKLQALNEQLSILSVTDPLTGIYNRRNFDIFMERQISLAKRYGTNFSLVIFDIDDFKSFNDRFGHTKGDLVLSTVAQAIKTSIRTTDSIFRYGGEEFTILLPETDEQNALVSMESIRRLVEGLAIDGKDGAFLGVTASFGIACSRNRDPSADALLQAADRALYEAKKAGKNRIRIDGGAS